MDWATEHLTQTRGTRLSEKSREIACGCRTRRLGERIRFRRRELSPERVRPRLSEFSYLVTVTGSPRRESLA